MDPITPTGAPIPFQAARAYGADPPPRPTPPERTTNARAPAGAPGTGRSPAIARLIAGDVPGGIEFESEGPVARAGSLSIYRHPADRHVAATGVEAGRTLDIEA